MTSQTVPRLQTSLLSLAEIIYKPEVNLEKKKLLPGISNSVRKHHKTFAYYLSTGMTRINNPMPEITLMTYRYIRK